MVDSLDVASPACFEVHRNGSWLHFINVPIPCFHLVLVVLLLLDLRFTSLLITGFVWQRNWQKIKGKKENKIKKTGVFPLWKLATLTFIPDNTSVRIDSLPKKLKTSFWLVMLTGTFSRWLVRLLVVVEDEVVSFLLALDVLPCFLRVWLLSCLALWSCF